MSTEQPTVRLDPDRAGIAAAAGLLRAGRLVAFPTETVYGLGADARSGEAVAGIYAAKGRPSFNPLIAHVATAEAARREGLFDQHAAALAEAFWPGPLTLVVPVSAETTVCDLARAGLGSLGLRVPSHPIAAALLEAAAVPIAAPSANRSGRISPTEAAHVAADLGGRIDAILDGEASAVGVESTIVSCLEDGPTLLRPGAVTRAMAEQALGCPLRDGQGGAVVAPGMLLSHYAPRAAVRLDATTVVPGEAVLDFGGRLANAGASLRLDLSPSGDLVEAAARLFGFLRRLDAASPSGIAVAAIPRTGLGEAIADRLHRAAAPRG